jgi:site-specific DNA recombinase
MKVAIYARKSNDDSDRNPENKSVARQIEHARAFAAKKVWAVAEEHIYIDDAISGAEYVNRAGFARLIASLPKRGKPPFDVLIMSEASRLGRDMARNTMYLVEIIEAGVQVWYYLTDERERADSPEQKVMLTLRGFASEVERVKAGQRSRDALVRRAQRGFNAGGVVFGYDNVPIYATGANGEQVKSHTDFEINEREADTVRRIFRMYAAGYGTRKIALTLNGDPSCAELSRKYFDCARPASPRKGTGSWAPSSVRGLLLNERYIGVLAFGEHRKVYRAGTKGRIRVPDAEIIRALRPDLRIVDEALWHETRDRFEAAHRTYVRDASRGKLWGRLGRGFESKYLLTGLAECACCGRSITKLGGRIGSLGKRAIRHYYGCAYNANRGRTICSNGYLAPMEAADSLVIERVRSLVTPAVADAVIDRALALLAERQRSDAPARLESEARRLHRELANLVKVIAGGSALATILTEIAQRETRLAEIDREQKLLATELPSELGERRLRKAFAARLGQFDDLLRSDIPQARQVLRKVIQGRIEFRPVTEQGARGYHLRWSISTAGLMTGNIEVASPRGFEPRLPP